MVSTPGPVTSPSVPGAGSPSTVTVTPGRGRPSKTQPPAVSVAPYVDVRVMPRSPAAARSEGRVAAPPTRMVEHRWSALIPRSVDSSRDTWAGTSATRMSSEADQAASTAPSKAASVNGPAPPMLGTTTGSSPAAIARTSTFSPPMEVTGSAAIHCGEPGPLTTGVSAVS